MMDEYLAHVSQNGAAQTILAHLNQTAALCSRFAAAFGAEEQGRLAGLAHDIGKYSDAFQRRLNGGPKVDHATAGAWECAQRGQIFAAFAVAGHHGGLPDGGSRTDRSDGGTFWARMNRADAGELPPYDAWRQEVTLPKAPFPALGPGQAEGMFFTRMLYSCLVDADFLDTEAFMAGSPVPRGGGDDVEELERRLKVYISDRFHPDSKLNEQRCAILSRCLEQGAPLLDRLRAGERTRALFRALGQYSVSIYPDHFASLDRTGGLELLEDGSGILTDPTLYSKDTGLTMEPEENRFLSI